jgi:hypothetical protein
VLRGRGRAVGVARLVFFQGEGGYKGWRWREWFPDVTE